jgi:hypothetical protein
MSQQQFFNAPENSPGSQPFVNPDPREQRSQQEGREQGYQASNYGASQQYGEKVYPTSSPRRRGRLRWLWITLLIILILGVLSSGTYGVNQSFGKSTALPTRSFAVQDVPKLVVTDSLGTVNIHTGKGGSIVVKGTKHAGFFGNLDNVQVKETPVGSNELDVTVQLNGRGQAFFGQGGVDLDITVPTQTNIQDTTNAGSLNIDGVSGQMNLQANAGSINVKNATLKGASTFEANAGSINYSGSLTPDGTYNFQADAGSVNLTLPSDSAFTLNASVSAGSVNNAFGGTIVGNPPFAEIVAHADAGSVNIHKMK